MITIIILSFFYSLSFVKTVCETGFNAGHSVLIWLLANPDAKVYSFDLGHYPCSRPMAKYLRKRYPDRFTITFGDSTETLPVFVRQNPDVKCDLISVDGGHTVAVASSDFAHFYRIANRLNLVLYDNHPDKYHIGASWELLKRRGRLTEYFRCQYFTRRHGFTFGQFVLN